MKSVLISTLFLLISACSQNDDETQNNVSGNAVKGVITNGLVKAFLLEPNNTQTLLGQARTNSAGEYAIDLPELAPENLVILELSADSRTTMRCDLVDGCLYPSTINSTNIILADFGAELPLPNNFKLFGFSHGNNQESAFISPLSHIIYSTALALPNGISASNLDIAASQVATIFNLATNDLATKVPDLTALADLHGLTSQQLKLGVLSAAFYALTMSDEWADGEINLEQLPLEDIFRNAAYIAEVLSAQLSSEQSSYAEALGDINAEAEAIVETFESKALTILQQPTSINIDETDSFSLHVQASGDGELSYQWSKNDLTIPQANSASYNIENASLDDAGSYNVTITDTNSQLSSLSALVSVNQAIVPISITQQPQTLRLTAGDTLNLSIEITGDGPFYFQWHKNDQAILGANADSYQVASASLSDAGSYSVTITSHGNTINSDNALVSVDRAIVPVSITQQPQTLNITEGDAINLTVGVTGDGPFSYQWQKEGSLILGGTHNAFYIAESSEANSGTYRVIVSNSISEVSSNFVTVTVNPAIDPVTITQHPLNLVVVEGEAANFQVNASGGGFVSYQWRKNNTNIANAYTNTLEISQTDINATGSYDVVVTNSRGSITSNTATLTVLSAETPVAVSLQPLSNSVFLGDNITLKTTATGDGPIHFQWFFNDEVIAGANQAELSINNAQFEHEGNYTVIVSNTQSSDQSHAAYITVRTKPAVQLSWDIPASRDDGSPMATNEVSAYILEYGYTPSATQSILLPDAATTHHTFLDVELGTLYARIATIDSANIQGQFSAWITITIE